MIDPHLVFAKSFPNESLFVQSLIYEVSKKLEKGHFCIDINEFPFLDSPFEQSTLESIESDTIGSSLKDASPFVLNQDKLYLHRYFYYETQLLERIKAFRAVKSPSDLSNFLLVQKGAIRDMFEVDKYGMSWQLVALIISFKSNFSIISGGPGTGKTTTVAKILNFAYQYNPNLSVALVAPTGKAASRLNESLQESKVKIGLAEDVKSKFDQVSASTIHRYLGFDFRNKTSFIHNKDNQVKDDLIIIDESSMVDGALMSKLLEAIPATSKVIMLGDKHQLASVEAGSVFGDLCLANTHTNIYSEYLKESVDLLAPEWSNQLINGEESRFGDHVVEFQKSFRFKDNEGIGLFSKACLKGDIDQLTLFKMPQDNTSERVLISEKEAEINRFYTLFEAYIREKDPLEALKQFSEVQILCATKKGNRGVEQFNEQVETYLSNKGLLKLRKGGFYHNQPIMITQNMDDLELYNGDIGLVRETEGALKAYFVINSELKVIDVNMLNNAQTVFAMSIHKSQGSEFNHVMIVFPETTNELLSRELLYTGVTRAKKQALVVVNEQVLTTMVERTVARASGIVNRIS
ncbi:exodeoxyribonuclease V subunit alpha [Cyclobacteriaceae bacterium]|nr:exodeoxyribonuclease V subunit alpha [Cyclobacteriaceae bacterium]